MNRIYRSALTPLLASLLFGFSLTSPSGHLPGPSASASSAATQDIRQEMRVEAENASDPDAAESEGVLEVRTYLARSLDTPGDDHLPDLVEELLAERYGDQVLGAAKIAYMWKWITGEGWVLVCLESYEAEISTGSGDTVFVTAERAVTLK